MNLEYKAGGGYGAGTNSINYSGGTSRGSITLAGDASNCKLSYIHQAGQLCRLTKAEKKEVIDFALKYLKGCVIINTIQKDVAEFIRDNYTTYYYQEVPIGYSGGFQYHVCIKNTIKPNGSCRIPAEVETTGVALANGAPDRRKVKTGYSKTKVEKTLRSILKDKNISTRFVNEFVNKLTKQ